jgi:hypothetical protein
MITIQLEKTDSEIINEFQGIAAAETHLVEKSNFNGQDVIDLVLKLTPISLPFIANVVNTAIKAKKQIVIKHKGMTIQGLSEKNSVEILKKLIDKNNAS